MKFQRRHYTVIAEMRHQLLATSDGTFDQLGVITTINLFADLFESDNPRFTRARFLTACGLGSVNLQPSKG